MKTSYWLILIAVILAVVWLANKQPHGIQSAVEKASKLNGSTEQQELITVTGTFYYLAGEKRCRDDSNYWMGALEDADGNYVHVHTTKDLQIGKLYTLSGVMKYSHASSGFNCNYLDEQ